MNKRNREKYETPFTKRTHVEVEASMCAGSEIKIEQKSANVEVDDYASIQNDITFE